MQLLKRQILFLTIILPSCKQHNHTNAERKFVGTIQGDTLSINFDSLENKYQALPVNSDTLYLLARQLNRQADTYPNRKELKLTEIYKRCADIYRIQEIPDCGNFQASTHPAKSELLCSRDSLLIIDCYKKAIEIYQNNADTLSSSFADVIFQLADVYEQLNQLQLALPYRQKYLTTILKTKGPGSEMAGDAFMFLASNYEWQKDYKTAYTYYLKELENRKAGNYSNLQNIENRIMTFKKEHRIE